VFSPTPDLNVQFNLRETPRLLVVVDAEEEFSWDSFSGAAISVRNIGEQFRAQMIMAKYGVKPTYAVDYPVATQRDAITPLKEWLDDGLCDIGGQLHTWVTPPAEEEVSVRTTFQCNLPGHLERRKLGALTDAIRENFGVQPQLFKAGRYGFGRCTAANLIELGYSIDNSVMPLIDMGPHGPDFTGSPAHPYWLDPDHRLLEVPVSAALVGALHGIDEHWAMALLGPVAGRLKLPAVLSRLGLLERIRLTPEGILIEEAKRLTMEMLRRGHRIFTLCYHSSSLLPGGAPYVKSAAELARFLAWLEEYFTFFFGPLGGKPTTPAEVFALARGPQPAVAGERLVMAAQ
jgi:hypothetical protein